jgi:hypothetical protein
VSGETGVFLLILQQMLTDDTRGKIENITAGVILKGQQNSCTTARNLLCGSYPTSTTVRKDFESQSIIKKEQEQKLEEFCINHGLWTEQLPTDQSFLKRGGEARVYLHEDGRHVIKLNDAIYYATWLEFLNSLLLHNLIFPLQVTTSATAENILLVYNVPMTVEPSGISRQVLELSVLVSTPCWGTQSHRLHISINGGTSLGPIR